MVQAWRTERASHDHAQPPSGASPWCRTVPAILRQQSDRRLTRTSWLPVTRSRPSGAASPRMRRWPRNGYGADVVPGLEARPRRCRGWNAPRGATGAHQAVPPGAFQSRRQVPAEPAFGATPTPKQAPSFWDMGIAHSSLPGGRRSATHYGPARTPSGRRGLRTVQDGLCPTRTTKSHDDPRG